jgi:hypothetical protein
MANRDNNSLSSRLLVHLGIALGALACFCCVPHASAPFIDKKSREEAEALRSGKSRSRRT